MNKGLPNSLKAFFPNILLISRPVVKDQKLWILIDSWFLLRVRVFLKKKFI
jgi:hypothetical protein